MGQVLVVSGIVLACTWSATQWTATQLGYQARLGAPWFELFGVPVYVPWRLFEWWFAYEAYAPQVFRRGGAIAAGGGLSAIAVAVAMSVWRSRQAKRATTYGSACWAEPPEIRRAGLTGDAGVFLGRLRSGDYLRHDGPEHVMAIAPTRSGKGVE